MKPRLKIADTRTPDGGKMVLYRHDQDFLIEVNGQDLMNSRHHESELELARLGCANLAGRPSPSVLIGGLGMGYTLRQALDLLPAKAEVVVGELLETVVDWNREFLGILNDQPLADPRVKLKTGDIVKLISGARARFDAILLDIDNGPDAMAYSGNSRLYGYEGMGACRLALREQGCLAIWSAAPSKDFEQLLLSCGFQVNRYRVPAYRGSKAQSRFVWVAAASQSLLPPGGSEPRPFKAKTPAKRGPSRAKPW
jgi:spermidine synthase